MWPTRAVPQALLDPGNRRFQPGLARFQPGGCYLRRDGDVTGRTVARAGIDAAARRFLTSPAFVPPPNAKDGPLVRMNLIRKSAGWRWRANGACPVPDASVLCSLETGGRHVYALRVVVEQALTLARYPSRREPRLRPTTCGVLRCGAPCGAILLRGREHVVFGVVAVEPAGGPRAGQA